MVQRYGISYGLSLPKAIAPSKTRPSRSDLRRPGPARDFDQWPTPSISGQPSMVDADVSFGSVATFGTVWPMSGWLPVATTERPSTALGRAIATSLNQNLAWVPAPCSAKARLWLRRASLRKPRGPNAVTPDCDTSRLTIVTSRYSLGTTNGAVLGAVEPLDQDRGRSSCRSCCAAGWSAAKVLSSGP